MNKELTVVRLRRSRETTEKKKKSVLERKNIELAFFLCPWPVLVFHIMTKGNKQMFQRGENAFLKMGPNKVYVCPWQNCTASCLSAFGIDRGNS